MTQDPAPPITPPERTTETSTDAKRPYQRPVLTEYGSVDDLVDSGVVGFTASPVTDLDA